MKTCAHVPEIAYICTMIEGRCVFVTKDLICAIGNLLLISGRQTYRAYFPAGVMISGLLDPEDIAYFFSDACIPYPGNKYEWIEKLNFSGLPAFVIIFIIVFIRINKYIYFTPVVIVYIKWDCGERGLFLCKKNQQCILYYIVLKDNIIYYIRYKTS